jgi:hypothetical protein
MGCNNKMVWFRKKTIVPKKKVRFSYIIHKRKLYRVYNTKKGHPSRVGTPFKRKFSTIYSKKKTL